MSHNIHISLIGGDMRQVYLADMLRKSGFEVSCHCLGESLSSERLSHSGMVVLPMPATDGNGVIPAPLMGSGVAATEVIDNLMESAVILGGKVGDDLALLAGCRGFKVVDYLLREELAVLNAIPTAEGALAIAMAKRDETLFDARVLITGMGRIAKMLLKLLSAFGADVTVAARKPQDRVWARYTGASKTVCFSELADIAGSFDIVFNTVPQIVIDSAVLRALKTDCLVIDLASKPGGVDRQAASEAGIELEWALSLPGKVAPRSAAKAIHTTLIGAMGEMGML